MVRNHFNPVESRHDSLRDIQQLQQCNSDFGVTNFGEFPRPNNQITNLCSPDQQPILPNCSIFNGEKPGSAIRAYVDQRIEQTWDEINSHTFNRHNKQNAVWGKEHSAAGNRSTAVPGAPPLHDTYQGERSGAPYDMPPKEVLRSSAQQYPAPHYDAGPTAETQYGGPQNRENVQGPADDAGGNFGKETNTKIERSYSPENTPIKTSDPTDLTIAGPPTISPQTIDAVLAAHNSPVAGSGQEIFDRCVEGGIDPAIALAFFGCESTFGTDGIAVSTNSWGNIRATDGSGGFKSYSNFMDGLQDWIGLMNDLYVAPPESGGFGFTSAAEALSKYAPPSENDTNGYVNKVSDFVQKWRGDEAAHGDALANANDDIADTAAKLLGQSLWTNSPVDVNGGVWGCAASVSEALVEAGAIDRSEYSAGVYGVETLLSTPLGAPLPNGQPGTGKGWVRVEGPVPGAVVCGYRWDRPGAGDGAHIGIVGPDGQTIYNNHSDSLVWSADPLSSFSSANYPYDVAYYAPPDAL